MCGGGEARGQFPDTKVKKAAEVTGCLKDPEYLGIAEECPQCLGKPQKGKLSQRRSHCFWRVMVISMYT